VVTEEPPAYAARRPSDTELDEFTELVDRIKELKDRIDSVRNRLAHGVTLTAAERSKSLDDRIELERLLVKAEYFMAKFG